MTTEISGFQPEDHDRPDPQTCEVGRCRRAPRRTDYDEMDMADSWPEPTPFDCFVATCDDDQTPPVWRSCSLVRRSLGEIVTDLSMMITARKRPTERWPAGFMPGRRYRIVAANAGGFVVPGDIAVIDG